MNSVAHPPSRLPSSQGNQLRIGIDCDPYPHVASDPLFGHLGRNVALLGVAEAPRFVSLQPFALQIPHGGVEVYGASGADLDKQLQNRVLGDAPHANRAVDRTAFDEAADHLSAAGCAHAVHTDNLCLLVKELSSLKGYKNSTPRGTLGVVPVW